MMRWKMFLPNENRSQVRNAGHRRTIGAAVGLVIISLSKLTAATVALGFEGFPDGTMLTDQYSDVTFANTTILTAGISLNEFEFPPHSGTNVASDDGAPMSIAFSSPIQIFGGYFTYSEQLTLDAFSFGNTLLASVTSTFSNNEALSGVVGSSPDEFLQLVSNAGIARVTITGDPAGGSFALDDATYGTASSSVPEPCSASLCLLSALFIAMCPFIDKKRRRKAAIERAPHDAPALRRRAMYGLGRCVSHLVLELFLFASVFVMPIFGQQHIIAGTFASPRVAVVGQSSVVTVSAGITDPAVILDSVNLLRLDSSGNATVVGTLHDDGKDGDAVAGDGVFTYQATITESIVSQIHFQVSAGFRGFLTRVRADVPSLFVQTSNASTVAIAGLAAELVSGNISAAVARFSDSDKANTILNNLNAAAQQRLANAFTKAQLVISSGDLRVYHLPWTGPNGSSLSLEVALEPNSNGDWVIVSW